MDDIQAIIKIVSKNKIKRLDIISLNKSRTKLFKLYELIQEGVIQSDEDAIKILYPKKSKNKRKSYFKLKYLLKRRLMNTIFFINLTPNEYDENSVHYEALRKLTEIRILASQDIVGLSLKMAKKLLPKVEKYEFWDVAFFLTRMIRRIYVIKAPDSKKFQEFNLKLKQILKINNLLVESEGLYYQLLSQIIQAKSSNIDIHLQAKEMEKILGAQMSSNTSIRIFFFFNAIVAIKYMTNYEYDNAKVVLTTSLEKIQSQKLFQHLSRVYLANLVACNIYLRQFEEGTENLKKAYALTKEGSFNWFQLKSTNIALAFHAKAYDHVWSHYNEAVRHKNFSSIPEVFRKVWKLYYAWIYLLNVMGKLSLPPRSIKRSFNLEEYIAPLELTAGKGGIGINVRIIRTVAWLLTENYDALIKQGDSIQRYKYRYIKNNAQKRANLILGYLIKIYRRDHVGRECDGITKSVLNSFSKMPVELRWASYEIEIVPFDIVVKYIYEIMIKNARRKQPSKKLPK